MNENYDYWHEFFRDDEPKKTKSKFVKRVFAYIHLEWDIEFEQLAVETQEQIVSFIRKRKKQGCNVPNIAAEIVYQLSYTDEGWKILFGNEDTESDEKEQDEID